MKHLTTRIFSRREWKVIRRVLEHTPGISYVEALAMGADSGLTSGGSWHGLVFWFRTPEPEPEEVHESKWMQPVLERDIFDSGLTISRFTLAPPPSAAVMSFAPADWLAYRCETARRAWRDDFARIMWYYLQCWKAGLSQEDTAHEMRITPKEAEWLRAEMRTKKFITLGPPPRRNCRPIPSPRLKKGFAAKTIRHRQLGYDKHSQVLQPEQVNPFD